MLKCAAAVSAAAVGIKSWLGQELNEMYANRTTRRDDERQREWEQENENENENTRQQMEDDEPLSKVEANALAHRQLHLNKKQQTRKM